MSDFVEVRAKKSNNNTKQLNWAKNNNESSDEEDVKNSIDEVCK
jgi:hypothetical protein